MAMFINPADLLAPSWEVPLNIEATTFIRYPAEIRELNNDAVFDPKLDWALRRNPLSTLQECIKTVGVSIELDGNLRILFYGTGGLGKTTTALGLWEKIVSDRWGYSGKLYDLPHISFAYPHASKDLSGPEGITVFLDERQYLVGQEAITQMRALLNQLNITSRKKRKIFITCGIPVLAKMEGWHLQFRIIGQGKGLGVNECIMYGPKGDPLGRILLPIASDYLYKEVYEPLSQKNVDRVDGLGGVEGVIPDMDRFDAQVERLRYYAKEHNLKPKNEKQWLVNMWKKDVAIVGSGFYKAMIVAQIQQLEDKEKRETYDGLLGEGKTEIIQIYTKNVKDGFKFDYWAEIKKLFDHDVFGRVAKLFHGRDVLGMKTDALAKMAGISIGKVSQEIGRSRTTNMEAKPLQALKAKLSLIMAGLHESFSQKFWELRGYKRRRLPKDSDGRSGAGQPDRVMEKNGVILILSCKSTYVDRDIPVYREGKHQHTGMHPELTYWNALQPLLSKDQKVYVVLEFVNVSESKPEIARIPFSSPASIPEIMGIFDRQQLMKENKILLDQLMR